MYIPTFVPLLASAWQAVLPSTDRPQTDFPGHQLLKLNDGNLFPSPAFGVGSVNKFTNVTSLVLSAFDSGYRHVDDSTFYANEEFTGAAIGQSGIARESLYVTTKFDGMYGQNVQHELETSLKKLGVSYVDLYLIHFPQIAKNVIDVWAQFEDLVDAGLARSIGVSNFNETVLAEVLKTARIKPAVNQIKYHAYNVDDQAKTVALCREHGILVEAYSALTPITSMPGGPADAVAEKIAKRLSKETGFEITPGQATLNWLRTKGFGAVTTSSKDYRQLEQLVPFQDDFPLLTPEEIEEYESFGGWEGTS